MAGRDAVEIAVDGLQIVGIRPPLGEYLSDAWRRRRFAFTLAKYRLMATLIPNRLGVLWIVLKPLSLALIYGTVFNFILAGAARPASFVQFVLIGVFVFEFFTGCFGNGSKAITANVKLVQSLGFPRILLPVSVVIQQAMRMLPVVILLAVLLVLLGEPIRWTWLLVLPVLAVMGVFNLGVALIVARMSVLTRDVQQIVPIINRVLFYASGIFFSIDGALAQYPALLTAARMVPTYEYIAIARSLLLESYVAPPLVWVGAIAWAAVAAGAGVIYFWWDEARYGLSD